jgi:hypothetical protein
MNEVVIYENVFGIVQAQPYKVRLFGEILEVFYRKWEGKKRGENFNNNKSPDLYTWVFIVQPKMIIKILCNLFFIYWHIWLNLGGE